MLVANPLEFNAERLFVDLRPVLGHPLFAGSIKIKTALAVVEAAELAGRLRPGSVLVSPRRATSAWPSP
jgi:N-(2-amino-2-carboxyethyl)-L-glutamate synthase